MEKLPKTREAIARLVMAELHSGDCKSVSEVVVVPTDDLDDATTWTVSGIQARESDADAYVRALGVIIPHFQRLYALVQKH